MGNDLEAFEQDMKMRMRMVFDHTRKQQLARPPWAPTLIKRVEDEQKPASSHPDPKSDN